MLLCLSARLSIRPSVPFLLSPPNRHGERGERRGGLSRAWCCARSVYSFDCVGAGDGGDCISRMGVFNCLPAILRLPGNTSSVGSGRHRVGSRSGSIASPPASYPLRLCIICPYCPAPLPRAISSVPFLCSPRSHRPVNRFMLSPSINQRRSPCGFLPLPLIAYHSPPLVSGKRGGFQRHRIRCV